MSAWEKDIKKRVERIEDNIDYARFEIQTQRIELLEKVLQKLLKSFDSYILNDMDVPGFEIIVNELLAELDGKTEEKVKFTCECGKSFMAHHDGIAFNTGYCPNCLEIHETIGLDGGSR